MKYQVSSVSLLLYFQWITYWAYKTTLLQLQHYTFFFFHTKKFYFQKFLERSDQNKSGDISIAEFIHYVKEHEKNLRLQFSHLDKNKDGELNIY